MWSAEKEAAGRAVTAMSIVVLVAHSPVVGVKVYVEIPAIVVLITNGLHDPAMSLSEVILRLSPVISSKQYGPKTTNEGITGGFTVTVIVCGNPVHAPKTGVII